MKYTITTRPDLALRRTRLQQAIWATSIVLLVVLLALGWKSWRILRSAQIVQQQMQQVQFAATTPTARDSLRPRLAALSASTRALHAEARPLLPLMHLAGWLPGIGTDIGAFPHILTTALHLTSATDAAADALLPLIPLIENPPAQWDAATLTQVQRQLSPHRPQLIAAQREMQQAQQAWARVPVEQLSPALRSRLPLAQVQLAVPALDVGLGLALASESLATPLAPLWAAYEQQGELTPALVGQFVDSRPQLIQARTELATAYAAWQQLPFAALPNDMQQRIVQANPIIRMLDAGGELILAASYIAEPLAPLLTTPATGMPLQGEQLGHIQQQREAIVAAQATFAAAAQQWQAVPFAMLPKPLQQAVEPINANLPLALTALQVLPLLPDLLGTDGPRTYLLLLQNPDELRPTGGFISAAGTLTLEAGRITELSVRDATLFDDYTAGDYPLAPEPLRRYMGLYLLLLRDSNWSPDFPQSAAIARDLFTMTQRRPLDGVIALTPTTVEQLVGALGTLPLSDTDTILTADTIVPYMREAWNPTEAVNAEWNQRKTDYLERLAQALRTRLDQGIPRDQLQPLAESLIESLDTRHLLLAVDQPEAAALFAERGWDGAVAPRGQDYVQVVDANVGYNKVNAVIQHELDYTVDLRDHNAPQATLTLRYINTNPPVPPDQPPCQLQIVFLEGDYRDMFAGCYWNYLRVLVPAGSQLAASQTHPTPAAWLLSNEPDDGAVQVQAGPADTLELGTLLVVPQGEQRSLSLTYGLPATVVQPLGDALHYQLIWQKQSGREAVPATITLRLPDGAQVLHSSPALAPQADGSYRLSTDLARDVTLDLVFAP